jgi:hypothetical protein
VPHVGKPQLAQPASTLDRVAGLGMLHQQILQCKESVVVEIVRSIALEGG